MHFEIKIELGNEAMQTWGDIRNILEAMVDTLRASYAHDETASQDYGIFHDENGNRVGEWKVVP